MKTPNIFAACALAIGLVVAVSAPAQADMMKKPMMMHKKMHHPMCHTMMHGKKHMVMCHVKKDHMMMQKPMMHHMMKKKY